MKDTSKKSDHFTQLRQRAEAALAREAASELTDQSLNDVRQLLSELQIHQIELEMQNEELRQAHNLLAVEREKYADLYNFAPVAYFTVDRDDVIIDLNLAAAELLGHEPRYLIDRPITPYLTPESLHNFILHRERARGLRIPQTCELVIRRRDGSQAIVQTRTVALEKDSATHPRWRSVMTDISERKAAEGAIQKAEVRYHALFEQSHDAVFILEPDGTILDLNHRAAELLGYAREELLFHPIVEVSAEPNHTTETIRLLVSGKIIPLYERKLRKKNNEIISVEVIAELVKDAGGNALQIQIVARDITERKKAEQITQLRLDLLEYSTFLTAEALMTKALDGIERLTDSQISFFNIVDSDQTTLIIQAWSTRTTIEFCNVTGLWRHYNLDQAGVWADCVKKHAPVIHNEYLSLPNRKGLPIGHTPIIRDMVVPVYREGRVVALLGVGNKPTGYHEVDIDTVSFIADITWEIVQRKRAEEELINAHEQLSRQLKEIEQLQTELREQALRDPLTGLYNRRYLAETLEHELGRCKRENCSLSVIIMDIDHFKDVNDNHGHQAGDRFLHAIANLIKRDTRDSDFVCRYGGEEFVLLMPGADLDSAARRAQELRARCEDLPLFHEKERVKITLSFGVASFPQHGSTSDEVLIKADKALYQSKRNGRNQVTIWAE